MKRKISTMTTMAVAFHKLMLALRLCCCPEQVHEQLKWGHRFEVQLFLRKQFSYLQRGHVLRTGFHHYFSSPNINR